MIIATLAVVVAGCTVPGTAEPVQVDLAQLDYGEYQHIPLSVPPGTEYTGRIIESMRLAEIMVNPARADPALALPTKEKPIAPLPTPAKVSGVLSEQARAVLTEHGMLSGVVVSGADSAAARKLMLVALRMPDQAAATAAAAAIDATDAAVSTENVAIGIPNYPAAHAHWRPTVASMAATIARGTFVLSVLAEHTTPDPVALTTLISKAFEAQLPGLDHAVLTPPEQFASLPIDPENMLSRMVPEKPGRWSMPAVVLIDPDMIAGAKAMVHVSGVVYGPHAGFLFGSRQRGSTDVLAMIGFDGLQRFPDATEARRALQRTDPMYDAMRAVSGPAGLTDVRCGEQGDNPAVRYVCRVPYGRYVATVFSAEEQQIRQKAAAQYSLLVRAE
ncbi:DUF7373 family lipoprotein [Nocardia sp. FBN12]|uniref:DUF7373 family lipoprotein n=1 Tax=Nocardia sp. FBN12 TaxID=3419766 RepID=UPI003D02BAB7